MNNRLLFWLLFLIPLLLTAAVMGIATWQIPSFVQEVERQSQIMVFIAEHRISADRGDRSRLGLP